MASKLIITLINGYKLIVLLSTYTNEYFRWIDSSGQE